MAKLGTWTSPYTSPTFKYDIYADVTARGSGTATVKVTVDAYMTSSASNFAFELDGQVNPQYVASQTKTIVSPSTPLSGTTKRRVTYTFNLTGVPAGGDNSATLVFTGQRPGGEGNSGRITVNTDFDIPAYALAPTAPTGVTSARVSDTHHTITWTRTATSDRPYTDQRVQRWDNVTGSWYNVATISGSATSYADTTTQSNRSYQWRIRSTNDAGVAYSTASALRDTTPMAPAHLVATKTTTDVVLTWYDNARNEAGTEVWHSADGGAYELLHTTAANAATWTHVAPSGSATHRYKVRAKATNGGTLYSAYSLESAIITLLAPPNAPVGLSPNGSGTDATATIPLTWTHSPADGTAQTAYAVRYRLVGGSWTTTSKTTSATPARNLSAGTLTNGVDYEWEVQTWGQHASASPWSATGAFAATAKPTVALSYPDDSETHDSSFLLVEWVYADAESTPQSRFAVTLLDEFGDPVYTTVQESSATEFALPYTLADQTGYEVLVQVWDSDGAESTVASQAFTVTYVPPLPADLDTEFDPETGSVALMVTNPEPDDEPEVIANRILRSSGNGWEVIDGEVPPNGAITDFTPPVGVPITYRVEAWTDTPSVAVTDIEVILDSEGRCYLNTGDDLAVFWLAVQVGEQVGRASKTEHYAGREKPVVYKGVNRTRTLSVSGKFYDVAYRETIERVMSATSPKLYRDPYGRRLWVDAADYDLKHGRGSMWEFSSEFTEVEP